VLAGGDYIAFNKIVLYNASTIALSGSTYTITLGTPNSSADIKTDSNSRVASWTSYNTAFDTFGNSSSAATRSTASVRQF
jgi:hypothetical protein